MLNVIFGKIDDAIFNTSVFFKNSYEESWLAEEQTRQMIFDIDKSTVLSGGAIESPVLGIIPPTGLSGGVKTLLLIAHRLDKIFNASNCGNNCAKWLLRLGEEKDVTINLRHLMDFGEGEFEINVVNKNAVAHSMEELLYLVEGLL